MTKLISAGPAFFQSVFYEQSDRNNKIKVLLLRVQAFDDLPNRVFQKLSKNSNIANLHLAASLDIN